MFPYIGGKSHHVKWLDKLFPAPQKTFVEVFGGAGWISWKSTKVDTSDYRVYNDFNPLLANAFECFTNKPKELLTLMEKVPVSNIEIYRNYQKELFEELDWNQIQLGNLKLAVKYLYLETQSFSGNTLNARSTPYFTDVRSDGKYPSKYVTLMNKLRKPQIIDRLNKITCVENLDCIEVIDKYDSEHTFFYIDPPYYKMESYYSKDFPVEKHQQLADKLNKIKGRFALSYYEFDDLYQMYPQTHYYWHRQPVYKASSTRGDKSNNRGTELVIMNYAIK